MTENETQPNIIDLVINQDPQGVQAAFGDAITDVISDTLDQRKVEMSQDMFGIGDSDQTPNGDEQTVEVSDEDEPDEVEGDELSDEEWDELINSLEADDEDDDQPSDEGEEKDDNS